MSNRQLEDMQEERHDRKLAEELGITYEELSELSYEIDINESSDGLVYNYVVRFADGNPSEILQKIPGLEANCVQVSVNYADEE